MKTSTITRLLHACSAVAISFLWGVSGAEVSARAQQPAVTAQVEIVKHAPGKASSTSPADASNVVVWLVPLDASAVAARQPDGPAPRLVQRNKTFEPHLLVIPAGTTVQFPNEDPFFHNVFSLFDGKRFDLGLYEAGTSRAVRFDRVGVSFLFCNIHAEMSAVVVAVESPYFNISDRSGHVAIRDVPGGRYRLRVWYERSQPDDLKSLERAVDISPSTRTLGTIVVQENSEFKLDHKNKYGQDYIPPAHSTY